MHSKTIRTILIVFVLLSLFTGIVPGTFAQDGYMDDKDPMADKYGRMTGRQIDRIDSVISISNMSTDSAMFTISEMVLKGIGNNVSHIILSKPLSGEYDMTSDMAYMSTKELDTATMERSDVGKTSIAVAGASAIWTMKDIKVLFNDRDYFLYEFGTLSLYMPDGTVKSYKLEKPVKMLFSKERKMEIMDAYPTVTSALKDAFMPGDKFPSDAEPIPMTELIKATSSAPASRIEYKKPEIVSVPV
ncbi:hypothetical protein CUJ83_03505 [Methanocella sp. CWC-04]|uniref:Uncharacterized protein n=1 Tax=Methanooceanicella nereidis TaxID=2052831 RepID=A0AAP2RAN6_9EURY|nr:hypothetical protein [Methanocella sp. CWC-04]MCD1294061.1 hypothetical protein [Methanocella sp. CWC-04]